MPDLYKPPNYTVYFDTNIAYSKKPGDAISVLSVESIAAARKLTRVDVRIPEVVFEELVYQKFKIAKATLENLRKNSKTLSDVCGIESQAIPDDATVERGVRKQLNDCVQVNAIKVLPTPIDEINWGAVVKDSCWRRPPFEKPKSDDDLAEKGFRDRIILETIKDDIAKVDSGAIAFVCADNLLRTAFEQQAKSTCPVEVHCGFDRLLGRLELQAKTKSNKFTEAVLSRVAAVFYDPSDPDCVALSKGVVEHLEKKYDEELSHPSLLHILSPKYIQTSDHFSAFSQPPTSTQILPGDWFEETRLWNPVTPIKMFAAQPIFQPEVNDSRYHWKSTVTLVRLLRRSAPRPNQPYGLPEERIRTIDIDVHWSCLIDPATGNFSDCKIEEYQPTLVNSFLEANWRTRSAYDLPFIAGLKETDA